ncbi:hypothetical protein HCN44_009853 [Aphidius gifuensis]|uniref:ERAP1-like C-terminal domain-containing protein n=1 Tax=Aphidius gifuensis TaxID=684658 RepID=A0A834Y1L4_APHGI|nr:hypothetical protein HCN44_009853 [Aphidius gifuensis]
MNNDNYDDDDIELKFQEIYNSTDDNNIKNYNDVGMDKLSINNHDNIPKLQDNKKKGEIFDNKCKAKNVNKLKSIGNICFITVIHVERTDNIINLEQERFLLKNPDNIDVNNTWLIPITWALKSNPDFLKTAPTNWLSSSTASITIDNPKNSIINVLKSDKFKNIHEINRAAIIDDLLNLARANYVAYSIALSATEYLIQTTDYIPWRAVFNGFTYLNKVLAGKDIYNLNKVINEDNNDADIVILNRDNNDISQPINIDSDSDMFEEEQEVFS